MVALTPTERLLSKIVMRGPNECWGWNAFVGTWGYGLFWLDGQSINASRAAYLLLVGEIRSGLSVCHRCDNPICTNPNHLFLGTQGDNVRDCQKKGRGRGMFSERKGRLHPRHSAKLTPEIVATARQLYQSGISQTELGRRYGVSSSVMSRAVRGLSWKEA